MTRFILAAAILFATPALAADPTPPAPKTAQVTMDATDLQVVILAVANAGTACDQGVAAVCPVVTARAATLAKLQAAWAQVQKAAAPVK